MLTKIIKWNNKNQQNFLTAKKVNKTFVSKDQLTIFLNKSTNLNNLMCTVRE